MRERPRTQVQRRDRLPRHPELIDDVTHALDVLEEQVGRIVEVHVRLRRAVDDELEGAGHEPVGADLGVQPALEAGRSDSATRRA